jgi:homoserine dehydrogenase
MKNGYTKSIFILGLGNIGSGLFRLISKRHDINIIGVANSRKYLLGNSLEQMDLLKLKNNLNNSSTSMYLDQLVNEMVQNKSINKIMIDCTSNTKIPIIYEQLLSNNIKVVTPNKKSMSENYQLFEKLFNYYQNNMFQFETTVGAGLPVINLLDSLVRCGHNIKKVEGMFSGTLNYVLSSFINQDNISITEVIRNAHQSGYTEPNPLDDLNGMDVTRKMLIIVRMIGLKINLPDIPVKGLVDFSTNNADDFFEQMKELDAEFKNKKDSAKQKGNTLKYIASYDAVQKSLSVEMKEINKSHPFYNINGTNNVIAITTDIYDEPVILTGYGAGTFQTASGILNDILKT